MEASYIMLPVFMTLIIGVATQMEDIAQDASDKALAFSDDMNHAMDCATRGVPIKECSPELMSHDFSPEKEAYLEALREFKEQAEAQLENATETDT
ncbi:hypothetical protein KY327_00135 [Candidatus Woesearchaeota archaeon]|nr:hypothetical protein [Candidatus Woesearchaeota archaeon]